MIRLEENRRCIPAKKHIYRSCRWIAFYWQWTDFFEERWLNSDLNHSYLYNVPANRNESISSWFCTELKLNFEDMSRGCSELRYALCLRFLCQVADLQRSVGYKSWSNSWKGWEESSQQTRFFLALLINVNHLNKLKTKKKTQKCIICKVMPYMFQKQRGLFPRLVLLQGNPFSFPLPKCMCLHS